MDDVPTISMLNSRNPLVQEMVGRRTHESTVILVFFSIFLTLSKSHSFFLLLFMVAGILQERTKNLGYRREDFP